VGCRTNQADSLLLGRRLAGSGLEVVGDPAGADVVVVNSCAVTQRAARDVRRIVGGARRAAPAAQVVVTGCMVEVESEELFVSLGADRVVRRAHGLLPASILGEPPGDREPCAQDGLDVFRPPVKIQEGCDVGCTYCIVPRTRGRERSVDAGRVAEQVRSLAAAGAAEVVLTGTQLGAWGRDLAPPSELSRLVANLLERSTVRRIRLSSIEPWGLGEGLVALLARRPAGLCAHLHVPLQSGSDRVLASMGRPCTAKQWRRRVEEAVDRRPDLAVGTDVLVGFPGETGRDLELTVGLLETAPVSYLHVFPFSARPGTAAARMAGRPDARTVKERVRGLRELSRRKRRRFLDGLCGRVLDVVVERPCTGGGMIATSSEYARVRVADADVRHAGTLARVAVDGREGERLAGRLAAPRAT
jgi:threonylcarbamoyladenosine tRNA methylthiotransferase MtaB